MSEIHRIAAFYSRGPHFRKLLKYLRGQYPGVPITAIIPKSYPLDVVKPLADEIIVTEHGARSLSALLSVRRQVQTGRFDLFVTMFDSPRLRILSRMTGVTNRYCFSPDGRYFKQDASVIASLLSTAWGQLRGRGLYVYLRYVVHNRLMK
ncbi:MAG TPA: hypothetical protein PLI09_27385 [Candidatus Hydrogenedentes bacterium]|nr:hypothetical protein [Candidatus Hydrogenedentota bacterium]